MTEERYAIIEAGRVANVALAAAQHAADQGWIACPAEVQIGWRFSAGQFKSPQPTLAQRKAGMLADLAARRWAAETGGTTAGTVPVRTDEKSQGKIAGAVSLFDKDPTLDTIDFEAQPGLWVEIDQTMMEAIGVAVGRHIQACFSHARALSQAIAAAATHAALDAVDIETGWPG